jgi:hypothetical protein
MDYITSLSFTSKWSTEVDNWRFKIVVYISDNTKNTVEFLGNAVHITDQQISFGTLDSQNHITIIDNKVYLVTPSGKIPFADTMTYENVKGKFWYLKNTEDPHVFRFSKDHIPYSYDIAFVSYCTCAEGGACYECGVLYCGCIDQCRGRCGSRS